MLCIYLADTRRYYGEDPAKLSTKEFFHILVEFMKSFEQAHNDNEKQKQIQNRRSSMQKAPSLGKIEFRLEDADILTKSM